MANARCDQCGTSADGAEYCFHHGVKATVYDHSEPHYLGHHPTKQVYSGIESACFFLCDDCVERSVRIRVRMGWTGGLLLAAATVALSAVALRVTESCPGFGLLLLVLVVAFASITLFGVAIRARHRDSVAEDIAIGIGRKRFPGSNAFWDSAQYRRLMQG